MKPNIKSVEVHPQLSHNRHPVHGAVLGAGSRWPFHMRIIGDRLFGFLTFLLSPTTNLTQLLVSHRNQVVSDVDLVEKEYKLVQCIQIHE